MNEGARKTRPREITRIIQDNERQLEVLGSIIEHCKDVTFTSAHATADLDVPHSLGGVPTTVLIGVPSADARIYRGVKDWTRTVIYLRSSAACTARIFLVP